MKLLVVLLCFLFAVIPEAVTLKCYVCTNSNGNCNSGETTCPSSLLDTCMKKRLGDAISKSCMMGTACTAAKEICKNTDSCDVYCCQGDLCNESVPLKPMLVVTALASLVAVAQYFM